METSSNSLNNNELANGVNNTTKSDSKSSVPITKQEHLLNCLAELFYTIVTMKKKKGIVQPKKFIARLRKDNESFDNLFQQDAHEFLNYLLNTCADILKAEMKEMKELSEEQMRQSESSSLRLSTKFHRIKNSNNNNAINNNNSDNNHNDNNFTHGSNSKNSSTRSINSQNSNSKYSTLESISPKTDKSASNNDEQPNKSNNAGEELTWIHELFQGILVNETRCLNCDTVRAKKIFFSI